MLYRETNRATYQAMEALIHNLNTMNSRAGAQTPFSSINYGTDTTPEGRMVIENVLLAEEAGLGNGETPIFPDSHFQGKRRRELQQRKTRTMICLSWHVGFLQSGYSRTLHSWMHRITSSITSRVTTGRKLPIWAAVPE